MDSDTGDEERSGRGGVIVLLAVLAATAAAVLGVHWAVSVLFATVVAAAVLIRAPSRRKTAEKIDVFSGEADRLAGIKGALAATDMPLYLLDARENIVFENPVAAKTFGEGPVGQHVSLRNRSPAILDMVRETIAAGKSTEVEYSERLPSTQVYAVNCAEVAASVQGSGVARYFVLSFRDISETRRLDRMRSDFVANASHELRTPLAAVGGFIETLQGPARKDPKAAEKFLGIMMEQVNRMNRLVDDLLSLSRLELKAHIAPSEKVDLGPLLGQVRDGLTHLANDLDVELRLHLPENPVVVTGDRDELMQVFENLIQNACKYGQEGKKVDITLGGGGETPVEVTVRDYGQGIPAEHIPRLTERFYRVSVEASRSKKGTGLGLAIVKHILTRHRARLIVTSKEGEGSAFTVRF
ncbi:phosphate regulon sensor histidine kinase PhoR [Rhizobium sp. L1K21]|uniref:phosphate regulon sensor histidine kinase PhoR n=1 Tax=Rhizobium sp. L1K21 TaxID=2954933 RepID=UPI0020920E3E|nr:phosphate regulon sensor histidine kinase PhoR [Rhizobium sp. L1K21]MCO6187223.1 phosphate regulon sensor histidine kinase PhoR [Rhizobium sp. L1K21]